MCSGSSFALNPGGLFHPALLTRAERAAGAHSSAECWERVEVVRVRDGDIRSWVFRHPFRRRRGRPPWVPAFRLGRRLRGRSHERVAAADGARSERPRPLDAVRVWRKRLRRWRRFSAGRRKQRHRRRFRRWRSVRKLRGQRLLGAQAGRSLRRGRSSRGLCGWDRQRAGRRLRYRGGRRLSGRDEAGISLRRRRSRRDRMSGGRRSGRFR